MMFEIWWRLLGRKWVPKIYLGAIVLIGLWTGIISFHIIPLTVLVGLYFGFGLLFWFVLLESINRR